ncbi:AAA family ATPase [Synechocystis sp. FACHB-383]|uniref:GumC family protein n=1 Tax=Synechocystis sp. FACHB-383 TaxID=2692864 RepID=UPI001689AFA5|nr:exopolysaccharide transport family protein [Synechocystis sp. FACHB-383]MBD2654661.1 AAA family ATPase [Synechocystis sp. FACHB-383]
MTYSYPELPQGSPPPPLVGVYGAEEVDSFSLGNLTGVLRRRWWIVILVALAVGGLNLKRQLDKPPVFQSSFQLLVSPPENETVNPLAQLQGSGLLGTIPRGKEYLNTQSEILQSNILLEPVWSQIYDALPPEEQISYGGFLANLSVMVVPDTGIVEIGYRGNDQERVKAVLEALAEQYLDYTRRDQARQESEKLRFVNDQLPKFQDRVAELQAQMLALQRQYKFFDPSQTAENISSRLNEINVLRQNLSIKIQQLTAKRNALEQKTGIDNNSAFGLSSLGQSPVYAGLVSRLNEINLKLAEASTIYTGNSPQMEQLQEEKDNVLQLIRAEAEKEKGTLSNGDLAQVLTATDVGGPKAEALQELASVGIELDILNIELANIIESETELRNQLENFTTIAGQFASLQQELELQRNGLTQLVTTRQALEVEVARSFVPWRLVSAITLPDKPINTLPRDILLSAMLGLLAGGGAALLVDRLDPAYHSVEDLRASQHHTILGYIPLEKELRASIKYGSPLPNEAMQESYAKLYSNLFFLKRKRQCHSFVVTSAESGDGKSTTAFFLAQAAAKLGQKVLLVDGDRYFPQKQAWLKLAKITGFGGENTTSDGNGVLSTLAANSNGQNEDLPELLGKNLFYFKVQDDTMTPEQLVSASQNFVVKMNQWKETFDLILIDTPPILGLTDSRLIADQTDGLVVVVRLNKTRKDSLKEAFRELALADLNVLGIVANAITSTSGGYGYYYGRYYSNRYYDRQKLAKAREEAEGSV